MMRADEHIDVLTGERSPGNGSSAGSDYSLLAGEMVQVRKDLYLQSKIITANTNQVEAYIVRQDDVLKNHNRRMEQMEREVLRLHNQQNSVVASVQSVLTGFGTSIGDMTTRVVRMEYYLGMCIFLGTMGLLVMAFLATK